MGGTPTEAIRAEHLPEGWIGSIVDRNGVFVARTARQDQMAGQPASADYRARVKRDAGSYYGRNADGNEVLVGYATSPLTGWSAGANIETTVLDAPLRRSLLALVGLGLLLALVATGSALLTGRRLARAFGHLKAAAEAMGRGSPMAPVVTRVAEVNQVGAALRDADIKLRLRQTERAAAELALRELNEKLEDHVAARTRDRNRLWESTNDLVGVIGLDGRLKAVNPAWTTSLGWSEAELLARPFTDLVHESDREKVSDIIAKLSDGHSEDGFVDRIIGREGTVRTIMWTAVPAVGEGVFYVVGRDVSEQRQTEEALRQAQKMEAIGQLTGGIAHDFNNMLAVIIGGINLLQRRLARGDYDVSKYAEGALEGATRAAALTHRLLAFSRQQPLSPEAVDTNRMIANLSDLLSRSLGEQNRVETVLAAGLWRAHADPNQLENVIINLAVNARDAMPGGGNLTIETANIHVDAPYARDNAMDAGQYVLIAVSDTGTGMPPDVAAKAFDPFFTTKMVGEGTGLGLSQVFGFARQSKGHIKIYSEVGHGTTIKLYLPRFVGDAPSTPAKSNASPIEGGHHTEIILVVEDEERVRNFAVEALRDLGYIVVHASCGSGALAMMRSGQDVTLLFTDIVMPGMTGRELVDSALMIRPELKVLYTTGYSRNAIVHNGVLDPGTRLLSKPFGLNELAAAVREALDA